jgi:hypothetical protein
MNQKHNSIHKCGLMNKENMPDRFGIFSYVFISVWSERFRSE